MKRNPNSAAAKAFKKVRLQSVSTLKKKADKVVSIFVRRSHANEHEMVRCYTCGSLKHITLIQCGHFISRNNSATRYDLENLRPQCAGCNIWGRGKLNIFADNLLKELGTAKFKALLARGRSTHQFTRPELEAIITKYSKP